MRELPPLPVPFMELNREIVPAVYEGWTLQMHEYGNTCAEQELDNCIKMFEEIHERRKHMDNYALYFANLLRDRKKNAGQASWPLGACYNRRTRTRGRGYNG